MSMMGSVMQLRANIESRSVIIVLLAGDILSRYVSLFHALAATTVYSTYAEFLSRLPRATRLRYGLVLVWREENRTGMVKAAGPGKDQIRFSQKRLGQQLAHRVARRSPISQHQMADHKRIV
jgi:hypothetical protein